MMAGLFNVRRSECTLVESSEDVLRGALTAAPCATTGATTWLLGDALTLTLTLTLALTR
jgi:hypothetical protein